MILVYHLVKEIKNLSQMRFIMKFLICFKAKSFFSHCLDDALLKEHGLLVPSDYYYKAKQPYCPMPKSELPDSHLRETIASRARIQARSSLIDKSKVKIPAISDIEELHKSGSDLSGDDNSLFDSDDEEYQVDS